MQKEVYICTQMAAGLDWDRVKANSAFSFVLGRPDSKKLAEAFSQAGKGSRANAGVTVWFMGGRDIVLEVSY